MKSNGKIKATEYGSHYFIIYNSIREKSKRKDEWKIYSDSNNPVMNWWGRIWIKESNVSLFLISIDGKQTCVSYIDTKYMEKRLMIKHLEEYHQ